jgi:hypothetical protein
VGDGLRGRGDLDGADIVSCPSFTFAGDPDEVARAILETAGVLGEDPLREPSGSLREP